MVKPTFTSVVRHHQPAGRPIGGGRFAVVAGLFATLWLCSSPVFGQPTIRDFDVDSTGTSYCAASQSAPGHPSELQPGGPIPPGRFMRLAFLRDGMHPNVNANSITFDRSRTGASGLIIADFDFRLTPAADATRGDGFGFSLLRTVRSANPTTPLYGVTGCVPPEPPYAAEEPNFQESLGIGFDIHQKDPPTGDITDDVNNNHVSVHFFGGEQREFPVSIDLAEARWIHARIILTPGTTGEVTLVLTPSGGQPITVVDGFRVPGFSPYEARAHFGARSGGLSAGHDLDNISVQFLDSDTSDARVSFGTASYSRVEGEPRVSIGVIRSGRLDNTVTIVYDTMNGSALEGSDYVRPPSPRTLTFLPNEHSKVFDVTILDDTVDEGDETLRVVLSTPTGGVVVGPSMAMARIVDDESARSRGHWSDQIDWPIVAIHMALLPTGKVIFWEGSGNDTSRFTELRSWDPDTGMVDTPALPPPCGPPEHPHFWDIFCAGHSFLADGRLFVTGGHAGTNNVGLPHAFIYNPFTNAWSAHPDVPEMNAGRWYPTNTTLANGEVLVVSGDVVLGVKNSLPQVWRAHFPFFANPWRNLDGANLFPPLGVDLYPRMFVAPDGRVFKAGPDKDTWWLDPAGQGSWTPGPPSIHGLRDYGSAVMYDGKVLILGGGGNPPNTPVTSSAELIDLNQSGATWVPRAPMVFARRHHNATLLPDGQVLVTGGTSSPDFNVGAGSVLPPEIYNPDSDSWSTQAPMVRKRIYHSTALLLPDGRVLSAGGGVPNAVGDVDHRNAEIYSPPYLFKGPRPTIGSSPSVVKYGQAFCIGTPDAAAISKVTLTRLGAVTHAFDQNQRLVTLSFAPSMCAGGSSGLVATVPDNASLAPPGHYMLFIVNSSGVPSRASMTQVLGFTDPNLLGVTVKAVHIAELRARINAVRVNKCGLMDFDFTDSALTERYTLVNAVHITQLQTAVNRAEEAPMCTTPPTPFTLIIPRVTEIRAAHLYELRNAVEALELR